MLSTSASGYPRYTHKMLFPSSLLALLSPVALAAITVKDPSDVIDPEDWAADNAVYADYDFPFIQTQPRDSKLFDPWHLILGMLWRPSQTRVAIQA